MAFSTRTDLVRRMASGSGIFAIGGTASPGTPTTATASVGHFSMNLNANLLATTYPGTLVSLPISPATTATMTTYFMSSSSSQDVYYLGYLYLAGTLNLAATGDQFTHNAATFPVTRTNLRGAATALGLIPMLYVTTATATTAPVIRLRTNAGAAGYINAEGSSIVGTKSHTFPAAATAAQSFFILRPEDGDGSVRDITAIEVTTAGSAGAASIYLFEPLQLALSCNAGFLGTQQDGIFGGLSSGYLLPAAATAGTASALLAVVNLTAVNASTSHLFTGVVNS